MIWPDVVAFVAGTLPPPPARVLEIGAGNGELAARLTELGYDVVAVDPGDDVGEDVSNVALVDVEAPPASFDAAVSVVSLHHVEPLEASIEHLATLLRPGAVVVVDEFDVAALDDRAMGWWAAQQLANGTPIDDVDAVRDDLQGHLHSVERLVDVFGCWFHAGPPVRGPYLHRWHLAPGLRSLEEELIGRRALPAAGCRFVATRADG